MQAEPEVSSREASGSTPPPRIFRCHHKLPCCELPTAVQALVREWVDLNHSSSAAATIARWRQPALEHLASPADIVDASDDADTLEATAITIALLSEFQNGQQLAGRILLQEFLPSIWKFRGYAAGPAEEDRFQVVVAEFWKIITDYPLGRGEKSVGSRIVLDLLNAVTRKARRQEREPKTIPVVDQLLEDLPNDEEPASPYRDVDLESIITWARRGEIIDRTDELVLRSAVVDDSKTLDIQAACAATGLSSGAARQRLNRARARLLAAARRELQRGHALPSGC